MTTHPSPAAMLRAELGGDVCHEGERIYGNGFRDAVAIERLRLALRLDALLTEGRATPSHILDLAAALRASLETP